MKNLYNEISAKLAQAINARVIHITGGSVYRDRSEYCVAWTRPNFFADNNQEVGTHRVYLHNDGSILLESGNYFIGGTVEEALADLNRRAGICIGECNDD